MFHCSVIKDRFCIAVCLKQLCYYIMLFPACQELFSTFLKLFLFLSCSNFDILSHPTGCCQELFSFLPGPAHHRADSFVRIPNPSPFVNTFFEVFYFSDCCGDFSGFRPLSPCAGRENKLCKRRRQWYNVHGNKMYT